MGLTFMDINNAIFFWKIKYEKYALNDFFGDQINTENVRQKVWQATFSKSDRI